MMKSSDDGTVKIVFTSKGQDIGWRKDPRDRGREGASGGIGKRQTRESDKEQEAEEDEEVEEDEAEEKEKE